MARAKFYNGARCIFIVTYLSLILERPNNRIKLQISEALAALLPVMWPNTFYEREVLNKRRDCALLFAETIKKKREREMSLAPELEQEMLPLSYEDLQTLEVRSTCRK